MDSPRLLALVPPPVLREGLSYFSGLTYFSLILFPSLFGAAIYYRKNSVWHKRFMLFAGFTVMLPALGRLTAQIAQTDSFGGINWPLTWGIFFCIMLSVPLYDFLSTRSIQRVTIISFISVSVGMLLSVQIAATEIGKDLASFHFLETCNMSSFNFSYWHCNYWIPESRMEFCWKRVRFYWLKMNHKTQHHETTYKFSSDSNFTWCICTVIPTHHRHALSCGQFWW